MLVCRRSMLQVCLEVVTNLTSIFCMIMLCLIVSMVYMSEQAAEDASHVEIRNKTIYVNGEEYFVRGVNYNPIPKGEDGNEYPYGEYFGASFSSTLFSSKTTTTMYTTDTIWEGFAKKFYTHDSYHESHLRELSKTFNTIRAYHWSRNVPHKEFLDVCKKYGLMVIVTFATDSFLYPDLTDDKITSQVIDNFRHMLRVNKGHPTILMWAISNEPNAVDHESSFSDNLASFFQFLERLKRVRDDEEEFGGYHPHPLLVPMADTSSFPAEVKAYDYAEHDVWGVQPYRGSTFGNLFQSYVSRKPLLVSEYGMDSYQDIISNPSTVDGLHVDSKNLQAGMDYQAETVLKLAREIEAENARQVGNYWLAATFLRGDTPDTGGGYAFLTYHPFTRYLSYDVLHRTFTDGSIRLLIPEILNVSSRRRSSQGTIELSTIVSPSSNTTSPIARCQEAQGLSFCSQWNGRPIGTCYDLPDIDALAQQLADAFGGADCARDWACTALTTCYFSANPLHWCAHAAKDVCEAAFDSCDLSHIPVPDFPSALAPAAEAAAEVDWVDADTPASARTKVINGEELTLVFSDEFEDETRSFGPGQDAKWEVSDVCPSDREDGGCYRPDSFYLKGGKAVFKYERNMTYDPNNTARGFRSAMLQGWNKFCFSGGYLEVSVKQPGTQLHSGVRSRARVVGNLRRAGYTRSVQYVWPGTYDHCDSVSRDGQTSWGNSQLGPQPYGACDDYSAAYDFVPHVGRGAPVVDLFELVIPSSPAERGAHVRTALRLGPKIPPNTTHGGGLTGDCARAGDNCTGIYWSSGNGHSTGLDPWCMEPDPTQDPDVLGSGTYDCIAALSTLYSTHFESLHRFGTYLEPREWVSWHLDDVPLFNVTGAALGNKTNPFNAAQSVGSRQVLGGMYRAGGQAEAT